MYQPSPCSSTILLSPSPSSFIPFSSVPHCLYHLPNLTNVTPTISQVPWKVCLADYCDILRCDIVVERIKYNQQKSSSLLSFLFPYSSTSSEEELEEEFENELNSETKVGDGHELTSFAYSQFVDQQSSINPTAKCDENHMKRLKSKCETIMNQCLLGLVTSRMVQSFKLDQDMDIADTVDVHGREVDGYDDYEIDGNDLDELNHKVISSICDLLSCDKSWKDFFLDVSTINFYVQFYDSNYEKREFLTSSTTFLKFALHFIFFLNRKKLLLEFQFTSCCL